MFKRDFRTGCMLVTGGARSGKSSFSLDTCNGIEGRHIFIATAQALDDEMLDRITRHRGERGNHWTTLEETVEISARLKEEDNNDSVILVDCLTLWLNNLFMKYGFDDDAVYHKINEFVEGLNHIKGKVVMVSNEVGMGIVPENRAARRYRDAAGHMNQQIGGIAKKVVVTFAGLPVVIKDE